MEMKIEALDHLVLTVRNIEATIDFYSRVLGMREEVFGESRRALKFGSQKINLHPAGTGIEPKAAVPKPGSADLCLLSPLPAEDTVVKLEHLGVEILEGPVARTGALGSMASVYIRDPDGNLIEIGHYGEEPTALGYVPKPLSRIVSGGQSGVDRGALDAALQAGFPCGGWCPRGRQAEDGPIAANYPLVELAGGYSARTLANVRDSGATVIIYFDQLEGGTESTLSFCIERGKPYKLIDATEIDPARAGELIGDFVAHQRVAVLNVAGPRASKQPGAHAYARSAIGQALHLGGHSP